MCDSLGTYIGVSPAVVDGGKQNVIDTCSSDNNDSDGYGNVNSCGDDIGDACFLGKNNSSSGRYAEIQYVDQASNGRKSLGGETNFTDFCKDKLGGCLVKEDEMDILVARETFLNKSVHADGQKQNAQIDHDCIDPFRTVNIGSVVSKEEGGHSKFQHVSGINVGSGTIWDSETVLTKCKGFNELLELRQVKTFEAVGDSICVVVGGLKVVVEAVNQTQVMMMMSVVFFIILLSVCKVVHAIGTALFIWFCFLGGSEELLKDLCYFVVRFLQYTIVGLVLMCRMLGYLGQAAYLVENRSGKQEINHRNDVGGSDVENHGKGGNGM